MKTIYEPRVLIYCHDGRGLGHLRRLSVIANHLQNHCAVLMVSGHREMGWLTPTSSEFIHLPHVEWFTSSRSAARGHAPFMRNGRAVCGRMRSQILECIIKEFSPDALIVDHCPLGHKNELLSIIESQRIKHLYYVMRGIMASREPIDETIFTPRAREILEANFNKVFVACDQRTIDVVSEYGLQNLEHKLIYSGYVVENAQPSILNKTRLIRGIPDGRKWIVCSAGGGAEVEKLIEACTNLAESCHEYWFDIIHGPKSIPRSLVSSSSPRVVHHREHRDLAHMHAAADLVIGAGGLNTMLECYVGKTPMISSPISGDYEQVKNAEYLGKYFCVQQINDVNLLQALVHRILRRDFTMDVILDLNVSGASKIATSIKTDLTAAWSLKLSERYKQIY